MHLFFLTVQTTFSSHTPRNTPSHPMGPWTQTGGVGPCSGFRGTRETWGILKYQELETGISRVRDTNAILQQRVSERTGALMSPAYDHTVGPILVAGRRRGLGERIHSH